MKFRYIKIKSIFLWAVLILSAISCREVPTPKPRGYFRFDFPIKEYKVFESDCGFSFEYPKYFKIKPAGSKPDEKCWYNLEAKSLNATIYLTYKTVGKNLPGYIEDVRTIVYKHIVKADDIQETRIILPEKKVYGLLYDISGNTASAVNFFITDSINHFISGSLYFNAVPNSDSLGPAIDFLREDVIYLMHHTNWK